MNDAERDIERRGRRKITGVWMSPNRQLVVIEVDGEPFKVVDVVPDPGQECRIPPGWISLPLPPA